MRYYTKQRYHLGFLIIFLNVLPSLLLGCRLWAVIANGNYSISSSTPIITDEIEALYQQGHSFRDGWGLAFYTENDSLSVFRSPKSTEEDSAQFWQCIDDNLNDSMDVTLALGHVRATTSGAGAIPNPHPFIYHNNTQTFTFIHNGTISKSLLYDLITEYDSNESWLVNHPPQTFGSGHWQNEGWNRVVDSELYFLLIMKLMEETGSIFDGIQKAVSQISDFIPPSQMNFIMSDGQSLYAYGGQSALSYSGNNNYSHKSIMSRPPETSVDSEMDWIPFQQDELIVLSVNNIESYQSFSEINSSGPYFIQSEFSIRPCFPNPFNNEIQITFNSGPFNRIELSIYNIAGKIIWTETVLAEEDQIMHRVWSGKNSQGDGVSSGQYYVQIRSGVEIQSQKILYLK
ncbi:MAG: class II glutamine amidotransferase [Candidatus Marinimicrobia bacterium]|nr:class II glutamine amidotransferase [Candidatus Neomarinimicrobiota bacterium]